MKFRELYENKKHGTSDFPLEYYHVDKLHPQYIMPLHWHRELEIIKVISGAFSLYLDNVKYELKPGDVAFVSSGALHRGDPLDCVYECVVFDLNMLRRTSTDKITHLILPIIKADHKIKCFLSQSDSDIYKTVSSIFLTVSNMDEYDELTVYGLLFKLLSLLYKHEYVVSSDRNRKTIYRTKNIITTIDWLEEHYTEDIKLKDISKVSGLNEKYLCHVFKEYTNHTPVDYMNNLRIEKACLEMIQGGLSVTEAAYDSGFNDLSYFSRIFKKYKGISPKKYKSMINAK